MKKSVFPLLTTDMSGFSLELPAAPVRIVSLVPSQTELLCSLGLSERICGVTKFCVNPPEIRQLAKVIGGTKNPDLEKIATLRPDLIMGNMEENREADITELRKNFPVWMSDLHRFEDVYRLISETGVLNDKKTESEKMNAEIRTSFDSLTHSLAGKPPLRALFVIWRKPYMAAGTNTFINAMLKQAGFLNALDHWPDNRYPKLDADDLHSLAPDLVFLSSEPYPFSSKHLPEFQELLPRSRVLTVDGEFFSWYGPRLLESARYFRTLWQTLEQTV